MLLFTSIILLCILFLLMSDLVKLLKISEFMRNRSANYSAGLQQKLDDAMEKLRQAKESNSKGQYYDCILVMRAEENVQSIKGRMQKEKNLAYLKSASAEIFCIYAAKTIISLMLLTISMKNRYTPVMIFDDKLNFQPLTGLMSFPTGVPNAISVPIWVLSCNVTFSFINKIVRSKM